jgi:hypothetical protein
VAIPDGYRSDPISPDLSPPFRMEWRFNQPAAQLAMNSDALRRWRYWLWQPTKMVRIAGFQDNT